MLRPLAPFAAALLGAVAAWGAEAPPAQGTRVHLQKTLFVQQIPAGKVFAETRQVEAGDTVWRLLTREYTIAGEAVPALVDAFRAVNPGIDPDRLAPGQVVRVPFKLEVTPAPPPPAAPPAAAKGPETYTVRAGDNLWRILQGRYKLAREKIVEALEAVARANPGVKDLDRLAVGQRLAIPASLTGSQAPEVQAAPAPAVSPGLVDLLRRLACRVAEEGETFLPLSRGRTVRLDARDFPVITGPGGGTVILDPRGRMAPALAKAVEEAWGYRVLRTGGATAEEQLARLLPHLTFHELSEGPRTLPLGPGAELLALCRWTVVPRPEDLWEGAIHLLLPAGAAVDPGLAADARRAGFAVHVLGAPAPVEEDPAQPPPLAELPMGDPAQGAGHLLALLGVPHRVRPEVECALGSGVQYRLRPALTFRSGGLDYAVAPENPEGAASLLERAGYFALEWPAGASPLNRLADLLGLLGAAHARTSVEVPPGQALRLRLSGISLEDSKLAHLLYPADAPSGARLFLTEGRPGPGAAQALLRQGLLPWLVRAR